jgi:hypothetical protein
MGISLEGFALFSLTDHLLTINGNHTWLYSVVMALLCMFELLLVTVYPPEPCSWVFHLVVGLFCGIGINTVGYGVAIMPRSML